MHKLPPIQEHPRQQAGCGAPDDMPVIDSQNLFGTSRRLMIRHDNRAYLLQITRQGKLILTR